MFPHEQAPARNHSISKKEEKRACLRHRDVLFNKFVKKHTDRQQAEQDNDEAPRTLGVYLILNNFKFGAADEWVREQQPTDGKCRNPPQPRNPDGGYNEHEETGGHANRRHDDLLNCNRPLTGLKPDEYS